MQFECYVYHEKYAWLLIIIRILSLALTLRNKLKYIRLQLLHCIIILDKAIYIVTMLHIQLMIITHHSSPDVE